MRRLHFLHSNTWALRLVHGGALLLNAPHLNVSTRIAEPTDTLTPFRGQLSASSAGDAYFRHVVAVGDRCLHACAVIWHEPTRCFGCKQQQSPVTGGRSGWCESCFRLEQVNQLSDPSSDPVTGYWRVAPRQRLMNFA